MSSSNSQEKMAASKPPSSVVDENPVPVGDQVESPKATPREEMSEPSSSADKATSHHSSLTDKVKPMQSPLEDNDASPVSTVENGTTATVSADHTDSRVHLPHEENIASPELSSSTDKANSPDHPSPTDKAQSTPSAATKAQSPKNSSPSDGAKSDTQSPLKDKVTSPTPTLPPPNENETKSPMLPPAAKRKADGQPKAPPAKRYQGVHIYPRGYLEERRRQEEQKKRFEEAKAARKVERLNKRAENKMMQREEQERRQSQAAHKEFMKEREKRLKREAAEEERRREEEESRQFPSSFPLPEPGRLRCRMCGASYDRKDDSGCTVAKAHKGSILNISATTHTKDCSYHEFYEQWSCCGSRNVNKPGCGFGQHRPQIFQAQRAADRSLSNDQSGR